MKNLLKGYCILQNWEIYKKYDRSVHIIVLVDLIVTIILEGMLCYGILPVYKKVSSNIQQNIGLWIALMLVFNYMFIQAFCTNIILIKKEG